MNVTVSNRTKAILLLTTSFGKADPAGAKALTVSEWAHFASWLKERELQPEALLGADPAELLASWDDAKVTVQRIERLLFRGGALGLALEKWQRAGLWVLTRSDSGYPKRLKRRLEERAPAVLFGCGNADLLAKGGVAIVGSRDASPEDLDFATSCGRRVAESGLAVVSGGAKGVDEHAMLGALGAEGTAVGVLANGLMRAATSSKYRNGLRSGDLALVSPFNPEAGFNVGNAMARNDYIYCLADEAVVVATAQGKGGTWDGATKNLKNGWVPLWVKRTAGETSGSAALVELGAHWLAGDAGLRFPLGAASESRADSQGESASSDADDTSASVEASDAHQPRPADANPPMPSTLYGLFLALVEQLTTQAPATPDEVAEKLGVRKKQADDWLKQAVGEGRMVKHTRPVRFQWKLRMARSDTQMTLWEEDDHSGTAKN